MSLLLKAQRIIDGEGGVLEEHGVLVEDGLITRIAPQAEFEGFTGEAVTLADGSLLPGLIDCHVHLCFGAEPNPGEAVERMRPGEIAVRALDNAQATLRGGIDSIEHGAHHCIVKGGVLVHRRAAAEESAQELAAQ